VTFWQKNIGKKRARKMLVKFTPCGAFKPNNFTATTLKAATSKTAPRT